jgi:hypothetical protein
MTEAHKKVVVPDAPQDAEPSATPDNSKGAESLRQAADRILRQKCDAIAQALAKSSMEGHIQSTRFLYLLAEGQDKLEAAKVVQTLHSLAIELSQEPEWPEPLDEHTAETAIGSREPEA